MKHSIRFMDRKYFLRLLITLMVFILLLQIPFSIFVLRISQQSLLNNINVSNQTVLDQLLQNYNSYSSNISSLAATIFWRDDIQSILYSPDPSYEDVYFTLRELYGTFIASHSSLQSICLYNKNNQELYIITSLGSIEKQSILDFVHAQDSIKPLQPLLHNLDVQTRGSKTDLPIFSYFMYQFSDPSQNNESFLLLNQYAEQSITTIDTFSGSSDSTPTATYYVTNNAHIASKVLSPEVTQAHEQLLESFRKQRGDLPLAGGFYSDTTDGKEYLISYINTTSNDASLVIIQDHDIVFSELTSLKTSFVVFFVIFLVIAIVLVLFIAQFLYKPVNTILDFFQQTTPTESPVRKINEFELIQHAYKTASEQNQVLETRDMRYRPIALQYGIASLLRKNNVHSIEQFFRANPSHWITNYQGTSLSIVMMQLVFPQNSTYSSDDDLSTLLYGLQNIAEELLEPNYLCASFRHTRDTLGLVISPKNGTTQNVLLDAVKQTQLVMKEHFSLSLAAAISSETDSLTELASLQQEASTCLSYTFLFGPNIIMTDLIAANENSNQTVYPSELDVRLENAISQLDLEECKRTLYEIKTVLKQLNIRNAIVCTTALLNQIYNVLSKNIKITSLSPVPIHTVYGFISNSGTIDQCFDTLLNYIHENLCEQPYETKNNNELFVNSIFQFIQNSYFDPNLSSQMIADYFGLSNRYLMKKFKTLTGLSLNEYITDLRLKMAASLLRDTDSSISNIAEQVGIDNLSYFYRLFKKVYDCTPKEFRENGGNTPEA